MDLFARPAQGESQRKAGVDVETATGAGDEYPLCVAESREEAGLLEGEHREKLAGAAGPLSGIGAGHCPAIHWSVGGVRLKTADIDGKCP